jgi:hypothetical protein
MQSISLILRVQPLKVCLHLVEYSICRVDTVDAFSGPDPDIPFIAEGSIDVIGPHGMEHPAFSSGVPSSVASKSLVYCVV